MKVDGATAIVTGGASGIGAELTRLLTDGGATVLAVDLDETGLDAIAAETGCLTSAFDITDEATCDAIVEAALTDLGGLDLAFFNAGILGRAIGDQGEPYGARDLDSARYRAVMAVNVDGVVYGSLAAWRAMAADNGGAIVVTSSAAGLAPWAPDPFYTISKHGVVGWVRAVADAMAGDDVTIDAICPGGVATPLVGADSVSDRPTLLAPAEVAQVMIDAALEPDTGRAISVIAGRNPVAQPHTFNSIPGFAV